MTVTSHREVIVVGGGIAGYTAGLYAKRYNLDVLVLEKAAPGGQTLTAARIENYPGFPDGITGPELVQRVQQQAENHGVPTELAEVTGLAPASDEWLLHASRGEYLTTALIITAGAHPRSLQVPGEKELRGAGVSYCATCDGFFFRGQTVAVVGGGDTALEEALYLSGLAAQVYVIHRRDELRAQPYLQEKAVNQDNIEFIWDTVVTAIVGGEQVAGLQLQNKQTGHEQDLAVDGVFIAVGYLAATGWLGATVELHDGFIVTDQHMRASQPGIFAAGDIRDTPLRQIATAVGDASIAAYSTYQYIAQRK